MNGHQKLIALALAAGVLLPVAAARAGSISGVVKNAKQCQGVVALMRTSRHKKIDPRRPIVHKGKFHRKTGEFTIPNLPDGVYDLRLLVKGGWLSGADMRLNPYRESSDIPLTAEDRKAIIDKVANFPERFMDTIRVIHISGNGEFARVLVEKLRYRKFHAGKGGDLIWKIEVWTVEKRTTEWVKKQHGWFVLARVQTPKNMKKDDFLKRVWLFDPKLGGLDLKRGKSVKEFEYTMPAKLDMSLGKIPGSLEKQIKEHREKNKHKYE